MTTQDRPTRIADAGHGAHPVRRVRGAGALVRALTGGLRGRGARGGSADPRRRAPQGGARAHDRGPGGPRARSTPARPPSSCGRSATRSRSSRRWATACSSARRRSCSCRGVGRRCTRTRSPARRLAPAIREEDRAFADALVASAKDREEHAVVVEEVVAALEPRVRAACAPTPSPCSPRRPTCGTCPRGSADASASRLRAPLDLMAALHPTPAVGRYADGRGARAPAAVRGVRPRRVRGAGRVGGRRRRRHVGDRAPLRVPSRPSPRLLYAGAGIVGDSDPAAELDETDRKFRAFLDALRWG